MADFEKVYSIEYDVRKALDALKRLEKMLVSLDNKSKNLFRDTRAFDKQSLAAKKLELEQRKIAQKGEIERSRQRERADRERKRSTERAAREQTRIAERAERMRTRAAEQAERRDERIQRERTRNAQRAEAARVRATERAERMRTRAAEQAERRDERIQRERTRNAQRAEAARQRAAARSSSRLRVGGAVGAGIGITGRTVASVGAIIGVARGVRDVTSEFLDFDQAITSASAKFSRLEPTLRPGTEGFKAFAREIRAAGVGTEHSAAAVAQAMDFWAKAGKSAEESKAVLRATLDFASANQDASGNMLDVARAGDILSDTLGAFRLPMKDAGELMASTARVSDVMSAAANRANMSAEELFDAFTNAGPALASVGSSIEETSALLATMANAGIKGSQAGNQLKMVISNLGALTGPQEAMLAKLGVTVKDSEGNFKGLTTIIKELNEATKDMGTADRYQVFAKAAGRRAVPAFINLLAEGKLNLDAMTDSLRKAGGETQNLAAQMRQSATTKMEVFKNRLRDIGFRIVDGIDLFGNLTKAMDAINWGAMLTGGSAVVDWLGQLPTHAATALIAVQAQFPRFEAFFQRTLDNLLRWWGGLTTGMSSEWDTTFAHLSALGQTLLESYSMIFEEFKALFYEVVSAFFGSADDVETRWEVLGNELGVQISEAVQFISTVIGTIAQVSAAVFSSVLAITTTVVGNIRSIFGDLFAGILAIAEGDFLDGLARVGTALTNAITLPFRAAISGLIKLVSKIPGAESLAESMGIGLKETAENMSAGFELTPEAKTINRAGDVTRPEARTATPFEAPTFEPPTFEPQSFAPAEWDQPISPNFAENTQVALDGGQNTEALNKLVELTAESNKRQEEDRTAAVEKRATAAIKNEQNSVVNQVTVGPTSVKIEAKGASYEDVKRAVDRGIGDIGKNIKRGVEDGLGSIGPSEI